MPSKFRVRFIFRPLVQTIAKLLSKLGVTPNIATFIMFSLAIMSFISLMVFEAPISLVLFAIFVFFTGIFDGVDGAIARLNGQATKRGALLDSIMDRFSEFIIFLALLFYLWNETLWSIIDLKIVIFLSFFASLMISYSRARAEVFFRGDFDIGLMARSERLFFIFLSSLIACFLGFLNELLFLFMWLVLATVIFRAKKIKNQIKEKEPEL